MAEKPPLFFNRELSWLEFNRRVLDEAMDPTVPLLERLRFLAITASNLDEFFMVRVGGLQELLEEGKTTTDPSGMTTARQLTEISRRTRQIVAKQYDCLIGELDVLMSEAGIRRHRANELPEQQHAHVQSFFQQEVYPVITPMAIENASSLDRKSVV